MVGGAETILQRRRLELAAVTVKKRRRRVPMPIDDLVYDVGMNNGDDTAYYLSLGFRVVAIDANPELVEQAKSRFANEIASQRLIILGGDEDVLSSSVATGGRAK
jgi:hypothetical protein